MRAPGVGDNGRGMSPLALLAAGSLLRWVCNGALGLRTCPLPYLVCLFPTHCAPRCLQVLQQSLAAACTRYLGLSPSPQLLPQYLADVAHICGSAFIFTQRLAVPDVFSQASVLAPSKDLHLPLGLTRMLSRPPADAAEPGEASLQEAGEEDPDLLLPHIELPSSVISIVAETCRALSTHAALLSCHADTLAHLLEPGASGTSTRAGGDSLVQAQPLPTWDSAALPPTRGIRAPSREALPVVGVDQVPLGDAPGVAGVAGVAGPVGEGDELNSQAETEALLQRVPVRPQANLPPITSNRASRLSAAGEGSRRPPLRPSTNPNGGTSRPAGEAGGVGGPAKAEAAWMWLPDSIQRGLREVSAALLPAEQLIQGFNPLVHMDVSSSASAVSGEWTTLMAGLAAAATPRAALAALRLRHELHALVPGLPYSDDDLAQRATISGLAARHAS